MLMLFDRAAGEVTPVVPGRRGLLTTWTTGPAGGPARAGHLRAYLVSDLIRRIAADRHGLAVTAWQSDPGGAAADLGTDLAALNIHPAQAADDPPAAVDLLITWPGPEPPVGPAGPGTTARRVATAPVQAAPGDAAPPPGSGTSGTGPGPVTAALGERGLDPLALRLALLQQHYREPAAPSRDTLAATDQLLRRWREQVAGWARFPSKPMCAQYTSDIAAALDSDLDVPAALRWLAKLAADDEIPAGSKFEAFAYQDQVLGLDLARDIGR